MTDSRLLELREMLQKALELELFTLPPYLCALYSIPEGKNAEAVQVLQGVVMEEMLHLALVANVLNAVGGEPRLSPTLARGLTRQPYPSKVPHVDLDLVISLRRFSTTAIEAFMAIEAPERPEEWVKSARRGRLHSIGHFYDTLLNQLIAVTTDLGEETVFCGDPDRQLSPEHYYGGGGHILPVTCLADARDVISQVAQQGEGRWQSNVTGDDERFGQPKEVAHYYRFKQIASGRYYDRDDDVLEPTGPPLLVDWTSVFPMRDDPHMEEGLPPGYEALWIALDSGYEELLDDLHRGFNGETCALRLAVPTMHRLRHEAVGLMKVPRADGTTLGPPMWFVVSDQTWGKA